MVKIKSVYLKFIDEMLELCKRIPEHFSRYSNKIYSNHQHLLLLVLRQKLRATYVDLIEQLKVSIIPEYIGLRRIPHYTTLVKFAKRVNKKIIDFLLCKRTAKRVAVDGSGFESPTRSYYYRTVWNSDTNLRTRKYVKLSIAVDADKQFVLSHKIRVGPRHDTIDFKRLLKGISAEHVLADKGYDSKSNRKFVVQKLKAIPQIPWRKCSYRVKSGCLIFPPVDFFVHRHRGKVETVFSVIKRKMGPRYVLKVL